MAAGTTYEPITTTTLSSAASSVTFSSITGSYTDLVLVSNYKPTAGCVLYLQVGNGSIDTGSNYSTILLSGYGVSGKTSWRYVNQTSMYIGPQNVSTTTAVFTTSIANIQSYSNLNTYKFILSRYNSAYDVSNGLSETVLNINSWRSASAINTVKIYPSTGNFDIGSNFTLYGIAAA